MSELRSFFKAIKYWVCTAAPFICTVTLIFKALILNPADQTFLYAFRMFLFRWEEALTKPTCTTCFTCWSLVKSRPLKALLSGPNRWKSEGARSCQCKKCCNTSNFNSRRVPYGQGVENLAYEQSVSDYRTRWLPTFPPSLPKPKPISVRRRRFRPNVPQLKLSLLYFHPPHPPQLKFVNTIKINHSV